MYPSVSLNFLRSDYFFGLAYLHFFILFVAELKIRIEEYFKKGDEEALPSILEAIIQRKLAGKHEETDDELIEELSSKPIDDVKDDEFESDFEELYETDEDIDDLYNATDIVKKRMVKDEFFHMDNKKWGDMINEAMNHGFLKDTRKCEAILEDMLSWDKLLPGISLYACDIGGGLCIFCFSSK